MDRILVEIYLPAANKRHDVYIPLRSKLHEVLTLLTGIFTEMTDGYFTATDETVVCDKITGQIFNINMSVEELGLQNGSKLMLI